MAEDERVERVRESKNNVVVLDWQGRHHLFLRPSSIIDALTDRAMPVPAGMIDERALSAGAFVNGSAKSWCLAGDNMIQGFEYSIVRMKRVHKFVYIIGKDLLYNV